jgi:hypothetical protein
MKTIRAILVLALAVLLTSTRNASGFVVTLGGDSLGVNNDLASALYSGSIQHGVALLTELGAETPDGGMIVDLGVPAVSADGDVVFGAESAEPTGQQHWDIFRVDPLDPQHRMMPLLRSAAISPQCVPVLKIDPMPAPSAAGALAFLAASKSGRDTLFRYADGEVSCAATVGDKTSAGNRIIMFGFGSAAAAGNGDVVLSARVEDRPGLNDAAIVIVHRNGLIDEVARAGQSAPGGGIYSNSFGRPAAVAAGLRTKIAFVNRTKTGSRLYLYESNRVRMLTRSGAQMSEGKTLEYISAGVPALSTNGTVTIMARLATRGAILVLKQGLIQTIALEGQHTDGEIEADYFGDPIINASGGIFFTIENDQQESRLCTVDAASRPGAPPMHEVAQVSPFGGTLVGNQRGDMAFLGGRNHGSEIRPNSPMNPPKGFWPATEAARNGRWD